MLVFALAMWTTPNAQSMYVEGDEAYGIIRGEGTAYLDLSHLANPSEVLGVSFRAWGLGVAEVRLRVSDGRKTLMAIKTFEFNGPPRDCVITLQGAFGFLGGDNVPGITLEVHSAMGPLNLTVCNVEVLR